ncbi:50S rRNA methyltransferase [Deinococcus irradiatisoli]|uniref:Ribosomal RNA large subunit methyltransferase H n=1 Tax=Deinococcus irradiatisoli TaxID=2202254 RepID=A0A2Z3JLV9_9DEIO|nr:23S rRNA (pseudouridine(1915)-N(3))-methyltransferase RlmH [Deinococcus irradiatisoli]AWN24180.1 50S rRNA methyltransferase [Deinococcus irradiatisoli]
MRLHLITVGAPKLAYARAGWDEYTARLGRYHKLKITQLSGSTPDKEGQAMLKAAGRAPIIALDPRGTLWSSEELAAYIEQQGLHGTGELAFCIGGPDGHSDELRAQARALWSLGRLTLPHDLAMVVMSEALYRSATITAGEPYHR